jgi:hypothetical protein
VTDDSPDTYIADAEPLVIDRRPICRLLCADVEEVVNTIELV